jgi:hypothetical protein
MTLTLSDGQARAMEAWLRSAKLWSESAQHMVGAATELTNASRSLADDFEPQPSPPVSGDQGDRARHFAAQLRLLAETIEDESRELRDRYLTTDAEIRLYANLLD